ncbi:heme exporter protein A [Variovorax sp. HW608]|uniref:cytochrome c biogenesis heme-transporting ATPase CcmA n=1 Tax=Variovorax sp. HW608 TaxID=1034889 RepID=UPI00081FEAAF|nr:cytochrome c biogenesis heme-transporting ATPase CcmA [Variovorax sp. HW608]SCK58481.1 heme exporter protein A [Variovorax sp. HW608]
MPDRPHDPVIESGLTASGLGFRRAGRPVFSGIDFALGPGELLQVIGANGSGKTSLLRVLSGLLPPDEGELRWRARPVRAGESGYLQSLAYLGHADGIDPDLNAIENLQFAMRVAGGTPTLAQIESALASFGMEEAKHAPVRTLSQGQRRRVALARLALLPRTLWLLDEPLASLDERAGECFHAALDAHLRAGGIAVVATHQRLAAGGRTLQLGG